jgi:alpha-tubulin suppressor-like RCC1 family protein
MCGTYASGIALKTDGSVWAWGYNAFGQLGQNNATEYSSPRQIPGTWDNIASGSYSNYGVKTDGTLWGWGCGQRGELGLNSALSPAYQGRSSPVQIPGTTWARVVSVGNQSVGAVKTDGTFWTWGYNDAGMLGLNEKGPGTATSKSSPTQVGTDTTWDTEASIKPCPASNAGSGGLLTQSQ